MESGPARGKPQSPSYPPAKHRMGDRIQRQNARKTVLFTRRPSYGPITAMSPMAVPPVQNIKNRQLFSSGSTCFSSSSMVIAPRITLPVMKKVGVEFTPSFSAP